MKKGENTNENHTLRLTHDKRAIEAHKSNHPQTTDLAIEENPVLAYWKTLQLILPVAKLKTETFNIGFYRGDDEWGKSIANIIRFCVEYADERFSFQDELFFPSENEGGQLNYEVGNTGQGHNADRPFEDKPQFAFLKTPDSLSKHFTRFVSEVQSAAKIKGSFIMVQGYGVVMESNGEQWEFKHNSHVWISPAPKSAHQHPIGYDVNIDVNLDIDKLLDKKKGSSNNQGIASLKAMLLQLENDADRLASEHSDPTKGEDAWQGKDEVYGRYMAATEYAAGIRRTLEKL